MGVTGLGVSGSCAISIMVNKTWRNDQHQSHCQWPPCHASTAAIRFLIARSGQDPNSVDFKFGKKSCTLGNFLVNLSNFCICYLDINLNPSRPGDLLRRPKASQLVDCSGGVRAGANMQLRILNCYCFTESALYNGAARSTSIFHCQSFEYGVLWMQCA